MASDIYTRLREAGRRALSSCWCDEFSTCDPCKQTKVITDTLPEMLAVIEAAKKFRDVTRAFDDLVAKREYVCEYPVTGLHSVVDARKELFTALSALEAKGKA